MSWGAKDCMSYGDCTIANVKDCNSKCDYYVPVKRCAMCNGVQMETPYGLVCENGHGGAESIGCEEQEGVATNINHIEQPISAPQLIRSPFNRFDIKKEVVILHGNIYEVQSVTPKKVVLKFKKGLTKGVHDLNTTMIDGVFMWVQDGVPLDAKKVMRESRIEVKQKGAKDDN